MSGNIQLMFILLGGGLLFALGCLILEFKDKIFYLLRKRITILYRALLNFFKWTKQKIVFISKCKTRE